MVLHLMFRTDYCWKFLPKKTKCLEVYMTSSLTIMILNLSLFQELILFLFTYFCIFFITFSNYFYNDLEIQLTLDVMNHDLNLGFVIVIGQGNNQTKVGHKKWNLFF
jgi:hypothetical protein